MEDRSTESFNRNCKLFGLLFLIIAIGAKTAWYEYRHLPQTQDFPQYYMGGLIARAGEWESLYPIPNPDSTTNPGFVGNSELRPKCRELAIRVGIGEFAVRYMQPPPLSLLLIPLSFLPFKLSYFVWVVLLILAAWGIGLQAGRIYAMSLGRETRAVGWLVILVCVSPQAHRWVRVGNMSVLLGWLIGYATIELARRDSFRGAAAVVAGGVAKYAILVLGPLYLVLRRWRTIAWGLSLAIIVIGISLIVMPMGPNGPYRVFFREIAPTLARTSAIGENQALYPTIMRMRGLERPPLPRAMEIGFRIMQFATLVLILALICLKPHKYWSEPARVFAAALALMSWLLVFSPICWEHYHAYLAPFWGWLAYEGTRSRARAVFAVLAIGFSYLPTSLLFHQIAGGKYKLPEPLFSHLLCAALIMLGMSVAELIRTQTRSWPSPVDDSGRY